MTYHKCIINKRGKCIAKSVAKRAANVKRPTTGELRPRQKWESSDVSRNTCDTPFTNVNINTHLKSVGIPSKVKVKFVLRDDDRATDDAADFGKFIVRSHNGNRVGANDRVLVAYIKGRHMITDAVTTSGFLPESDGFHTETTLPSKSQDELGVYGMGAITKNNLMILAPLEKHGLCNVYSISRVDLGTSNAWTYRGAIQLFVQKTRKNKLDFTKIDLVDPDADTISFSTDNGPEIVDLNAINDTLPIANVFDDLDISARIG